MSLRVPTEEAKKSPEYDLEESLKDLDELERSLQNKDHLETIVLSPSSESKRRLSVDLTTPPLREEDIITEVISPSAMMQRTLRIDSVELLQSDEKCPYVTPPITPQNKKRLTVDTAMLTPSPHVKEAAEPPKSPDKSPGFENAEWSRSKYIEKYLREEHAGRDN